MPATDAALVTAGTALNTKHKFIQLHSASTTNGTTNTLQARKAISMTVDADGDLTLDIAVAYTGLGANQAVWGVSVWDLATGGVLQGIYPLVGDSTANSAGEYTVTAGTIPLVAV